MTILPFVINYWKRVFDHVYVFDAKSDDGSKEYMEQFPDLITVIPQYVNDFNDVYNIWIKNNMWKLIDTDWMCVCDMDEILYSTMSKVDLDNTLKYVDADFIIPKWYDLCREEFPPYSNDKLIHQDCTMIETSTGNSKMTLFRKDNCVETNFDFGQHDFHPIVRKETRWLKWSEGLYMFHLTGVDHAYRLERHHQLKNRLSETNKVKRLGIHYNFSDEDYTKILEDRLAKSRHIDI